MTVMAIDWSGAKKPTRKIWLAEARSGQIDRLEPLCSRDAAFQEMVSFAECRSDAIVGLDFAFSLPAWFLRQRCLASAFELWPVVEREGERWLSACEPPFWGRSGTVKPIVESHYRKTEERLLVGGHRPKSGFQINGSGSVGTGSIRGMPFLAKARQARFSVWPFDTPRTPMIVEIYPRALTGPVVKSSQSARADYLLHNWPDLRLSMRHLAMSSDDAFDAAISALVMADHRDEFAALEPTDELAKLEGEIWIPSVRPNNALHPSPAVLSLGGRG